MVRRWLVPSYVHSKYVYDPPPPPPSHPRAALTRSSPARAAQGLAQAGSAPAFGVQRPARRRLAQAPAGSQVQVLVRTAADAPADAVQQVVNALAGAQASGQTLADLKAAGAPPRMRLCSSGVP